MTFLLKFIIDVRNLFIYREVSTSFIYTFKSQVLKVEPRLGSIAGSLPYEGY